MYIDDNRAICQNEADEKGLYEFLWASSLPPEFPIIVENGEKEFDLTATRDQFETFTAALADTNRQYELLALVHTREQTSRLTDRQREYPLVELADTLGVDKSSARETIRRGAGLIIGDCFVDQE